MKKMFFVLGTVVIIITSINFFKTPALEEKQSYWLLLHRRSNIEFLYLGLPGQKDKSQLIKTFKVKTGIPGEKPTPLPGLLGREYWIITAKSKVQDNPETAPYFLTLDIPVSEDEPFGPTPYLECKGQCNWGTPGNFGLHGVNGNFNKLSEQDLGSSGCIRHYDSDISYLYNLLDPKKEKTKYYIEDL
ncbi:MAG: L,D-transpeptidase [Patescibacteria group bacterium]|nr:L,D-transpeptidase [Patescibacteria group bacterium]